MNRTEDQSRSWRLPISRMFERHARAWTTSLLLATVYPLIVAEAFAQAPGQFEREFTPPPTLPIPEGPVVPETPAQKPPPEADKLRFLLTRIEILDNKTYSDAELTPIYESLLGREVSLADMYGVADDLTARYRNDGYVLSRVIVPPQTIKDGVVQLRVIEGYVSETSIRGSSTGPRSTIEKHLERVRNSRPLSASVLERELLLINDLPGIAAGSVLGPSATPSAADLTLGYKRASCFVRGRRQ